MPEITALSLPDLLIDPENPRLPQPNVGQRDALRALAQHQKGKLIALAKDIVHYGLNPTELPMVMPLEPIGDLSLNDARGRIGGAMPVYGYLSR